MTNFYPSKEQQEHLKELAEKANNKEVTNVCPKCGGNWMTDRIHKDPYCSICFSDKPGNAEL